MYTDQAFRARQSVCSLVTNTVFITVSPIQATKGGQQAKVEILHTPASLKKFFRLEPLADTTDIIIDNQIREIK